MFEFALDVPEVDVDHHRARLEDRNHRLDGFDVVSAVQPHRLAGLDAESPQGVREAVGPLVEFGVGLVSAVGLERDPVAHQVDGVLDEVGDVVCHTVKTRTCYRLMARACEIPTRRRHRSPSAVTNQEQTCLTRLTVSSKSVITR